MTEHNKDARPAVNDTKVIDLLREFSKDDKNLRKYQRVIMQRAADELGRLFAALTPSTGSVPVNRNRASSTPGGCECEACGSIFIGGPDHAECGVCAAPAPSAGTTALDKGV